MTLDEIKVKDAASVTDDEKKFLEEHKAELSAEELTKFGLTAAAADGNGDGEGDEPKKPEGEEKPAEPEAKKAEPVAASEGKVVAISASELATLKANADRGAQAMEQLDTAKCSEDVKGWVGKGKVVSANEASVLDFYKNLDSENRTKFAKIMGDLPEQKVLAGEAGQDDKGTIGGAADLLREKTNELIKASEGKLTYAAALGQAMRDNPDLAKQYNDELVAKGA